VHVKVEIEIDVYRGVKQAVKWPVFRYVTIIFLSKSPLVRNIVSWQGKRPSTCQMFLPTLFAKVKNKQTLESLSKQVKQLRRIHQALLSSRWKAILWNASSVPFWSNLPMAMPSRGIMTNSELHDEYNKMTANHLVLITFNIIQTHSSEGL